MYTGYTALLIVFLTHPGVLIPIPAPGMASWLRAAWQATWVTVMQSFSEGDKSVVASYMYWFVFFIWCYLYVVIALAQAKT